MSVLVDHKKPPSAPHHGKSQQSSAPVRNAVISKGNVRKDNQFQGSSGSSVAVADGGRTGVEKMNMIAIGRVDGHVCDLLSTVPQVVLYQYEEEANVWVRGSCLQEGWDQ